MKTATEFRSPLPLFRVINGRLTVGLIAAALLLGSAGTADTQTLALAGAQPSESPEYAPAPAPQPADTIY